MPRAPRLLCVTDLWIGTYPVAGAGTPTGLGEGVWRVRLDDASGALSGARQVAELPSPSFLAARGAVLYAALEDAPGAVATLAVRADGGLDEVRREPSGGDYPCHLGAAVPGVLLAANYGTGTLGVLRAEGAGEPGLAPAVFGHSGSGPRGDRQEGPHAHFVVPTPDGRHVLVVDLGTDELRRYRVTSTGLQAAGIAATLPPGTGPRHLEFSSDGRLLYLVGELDLRVHVLTWDAASATGRLVQSVPAVVPEPAPGCGWLPSHLALAGDDVLVAVRGADVLTRWRIGADGLLAAGRSAPLGGHWPRHFAVVGPWVVVALERGHELVVLDEDDRTVARLPLPSPTCVLPVAR